MPFGFDAPEFKAAMVASIKRAAEALDAHGRMTLDTNGRHSFWVVAGSATLVNVLHTVFPRARFNVVQVGKYVSPKALPPGTVK